MDNEACWKTEWVQDFLKSKGIEFEYFPPYLGSLMNVCDNSFHALFKREYYKLIATKTSLSTAEKIRYAYRAYKSIKGDSIRKMFRRVGILGHNIKRTLNNLLLEGSGEPDTWSSAHQTSWHRYKMWKKDKI